MIAVNGWKRLSDDGYLLVTKRRDGRVTVSEGRGINAQTVTLTEDQIRELLDLAVYDIAPIADQG